MENSPKKSKALIITIIIIIFLLVIGFLIYKNRDKFGGGTSGIISKIFSPLAPSKNQKDLKTTIAQAGEDINAGDNLSISGYDENNNPIVVKANGDSGIYGFANQDILNGEFGQISINSGGSNGFWDSFSNFLNNLFEDNNNNPNDLPPGGWSFNNDLGIWEFDPNGIGGWVFDPNTGGWIPPGGGSGNYNPQCSDTIDNDTDEAIDANDPNCHVGGTIDGDYLPNHYSESTNPIGGGGFDFIPQCSDTIDNDTDEAIDANDPNCHVGGTIDGDYLPNHYSESTNPIGGGGIDITPKCSDTIDNDRDTLIDDLDPACHVGGDLDNDYVPSHDSEADAPCENGASNPPLCTIFEKEKIPDLTAGRVTPSTALTNTPTSLFSTISNIGTGTTLLSFPTLFTVTNRDVGIELEEEEIETISIKSKIQKIVLRVINNLSWISKVIAATTTNEGVDINTEISVIVPAIPTGSNAIAAVSYTFTTPGIYYIRACADKDSAGNRGIVTELNEDNNCGPWTVFEATSSIPPPGELPKCSDSIDNDRDTLIDDLDPACHVGGDLDNDYVPSHDSESTPPGDVYECNDNLDNDEDGSIDFDDPQCHLDGNLEKDYIAEHDSESDAPSSGDDEVNICLDMEENPLVFTDKEKAELAELLRKFYLLAPTLKTNVDIQVVYNEIDQNKEFVSQLSQLIEQCYSQGINKWGGDNPGYDSTPAWEPEAELEGLGVLTDTGERVAPLHRFENPWYKYESKGDEEFDLYFDYNLIDTKLVSGYFTGTTHYYKNNDGKEIGEGLDCNEYFTPRPSSGYMQYTPKWGYIHDADHWFWPHRCKEPYTQFSEHTRLNSCFTEAVEAGCQWHAGTFYVEDERMLNMW